MSRHDTEKEDATEASNLEAPKREVVLHGGREAGKLTTSKPVFSFGVTTQQSEVFCSCTRPSAELGHVTAASFDYYKN